MPVMYNTGDWFSLRPGNTYRKIELNSVEWPHDVNLDFMTVSGAPFGGPIALIRDFKQIVQVKGSAKPEITIFNSAGTLISTIKWKHGNLLTMGWSDTEELLCVQDDGVVIIYDMFGEEKKSFPISHEASLTKVIDAKIFASNAGTGIAVMTTNFRVFFIKNYKEANNRQMPEIPKSTINPTCWEIVNEDRNTYCLVGREKEILRLVPGQTVCNTHSSLFEKSYKSIIHMSISYNHRYLVLYTNNGIIWLGTTDMKTKFCEFDTGRSERPKQIEWILDSENCRQSDAVIITYPSLLLVINTNGDQNMFTYDPAIFLIPEMDGVRILTNTTHELMQKVPKCVSNIFAINSQQPSSFLFEAHKKFQEKSHQSDEYLGLIKDNMNIAVNECIEAAGYEFDTETQKMLIKTAYFGKGFIPSHNPDEYIKMCRILRVLNALRHKKVALPLTYQQFCHLKPNVILDRLVFRKHYAIAVHVAKHLKLQESRILEHWAFHKVQYDNDDREVARKITEKFKNPTVQGVSFCNIAEKAYSAGRDRLAIDLLELEPKASLQVPLLLKLGKSQNALKSATKSGDTDLVYTVVFKLKPTISLSEFQMLTRQQPMAHNLYKKYCKLYNKATLQDILNAEDDFKSQAEFTLREGIEKKILESVLPNVGVAYGKGHKNVEVELCSDTRKLMNAQKILSEKYKTHGIEFYGLSINDTLEALLKIGDVKLAEKFKNDYKIPDKRYWWMRIQVLSQQFRWEDLDKFSKIKKSPIGYEPFVEVCLKCNNVLEAKKYLIKCRDDKKIKWYIRAGLLDEASNTAFEQKDSTSLRTILMIASRENRPVLQEKVDNYIQQLLYKK